MKSPSFTSNSEWAVPLRIAARMALLLALAASAYVVVAKYAGLAHPHRYLVRLQDAAARDPDLVLFGDSVLFWANVAGEDKRPLEQRILEAFPDWRSVSISKAAANPELYLDTWRYLRKRGASPRAAVLLLNPRSFSPTLYYRPDSEFPRIQYELYWDSMVSRALYRPLVVLNAIDSQPMERAAYTQLLERELAGAPPAIAHLADGQEGEPRWAGMTFREHYYLRYGVPIPPAHPALRALAELLEEMRREGVAVFLFLTPVDAERGGLELGPGIEALLEHNRAVIRATVAPFLAPDGPIALYDASTLLPSSAFVHDHGPPNEHLYDSGLSVLFAELQPRIDAVLARAR